MPKKYYNKLLFYNPVFLMSFDEIVEDTEILKRNIINNVMRQ